MVRRLLVRSHYGNVLLAVIGALYALGSLAVLAWFVADVWNAAGFVDRLVQIALLASAVCGAWFISIAWESLRQEHHAGGASYPASIQR